MPESYVKLVTAPAYEPVSRAEAKRWLRIESDDTNHDLTVDMLIKAMREQAENLTFRAFIPRTLRLYLDDYPYDLNYGVRIELPHPPCISVSSIQYIDTDGVLQTMDTADYVVHEEREPAIIIPAWGEAWPTIRRVPDAVQVNYRAGYASGSPEDEVGVQEVMPAALRLWMESKIAAHDEFRSQVIAGVQAFKIPRDYVDGLLDALVIGNRLF